MKKTEFCYKDREQKVITVEGTGTFIGCTEQDIMNVTKGEKGFISPFVRPSETAAGPTMACALLG